MSIMNFLKLTLKPRRRRRIPWLRRDLEVAEVVQIRPAPRYNNIELNRPQYGGVLRLTIGKCESASKRVFLCQSVINLVSR